MISNLIRSLSTRSLITLSINLHRGQLLKRHSSINRLLSIINSDINRSEALSRIRSELSLTSTQDSLAILRHQLRIQVVLLTINQTLIGHGVSNNRTIDNTLLRPLRKLSLRLNRRSLGSRLFRGFGGRSLGTWDRNIWRLMSTATIRQSRLIRRHNALTGIAAFQIPVRTYNGNKVTRLEFRDLHIRIADKFNHVPRRSNIQTSQLLKFLSRTSEGRIPLVTIGFTPTPILMGNGLGSRRTALLGITKQSSHVDRIVLDLIFVSPLGRITNFCREPDRRIVILLRDWRFSGLCGLVVCPSSHRIWRVGINTPGPPNIVTTPAGVEVTIPLPGPN